LVLPFAISEGAARSLSPDANPSGWLLGLLLTTVGLPFFVVATSAPLLQTWFAGTSHPSGKDPYFLYGASNLGSMLALLGYPILMEPNLRLASQSIVWAISYGALATLTLACAVVVLRSPRRLTPTLDKSTTEEVDQGPRRLSQRLSWVAFAFVPSSLLLGVTAYLSTDVAAIPLLWVIPLALYLLTFVLAFSKRETLPLSWAGRAMRIVTVALVLVICLGVVQVIFIPLHLLMFFLAAMVCHGELARRRPSVRHLTEFYLAISVGGVLGGIFNALVAPVVFDRVVEYPLAIALACLALPGGASGPGSRGLKTRTLDFALPLALGIIVFAARQRFGDQPVLPWSPRDFQMKVMYGLGGLACFTFADRPLRFALGVGALLATAMLVSQGQVLHRERGFFGTIQVVRVELALNIALSPQLDSCRDRRGQAHWTGSFRAGAEQQQCPERQEENIPKVQEEDGHTLMVQELGEGWSRIDQGRGEADEQKEPSSPAPGPAAKDHDKGEQPDQVLGREHLGSDHGGEHGRSRIADSVDHPPSPELDHDEQQRG
jgi:hypothetical protein